MDRGAKKSYGRDRTQEVGGKEWEGSLTGRCRRRSIFAARLDAHMRLFI